MTARVHRARAVGAVAAGAAPPVFVAHQPEGAATQRRAQALRGGSVPLVLFSRCTPVFFAILVAAHLYFTRL